ncbi:SufE family protein [Membranicola marinus]|uniref:SufE family protein n=1 Tax=Membranihabitans marinus TaxID=1227546 RepID=A0A953HUS6_9BACT|nr:SufE family protein [Membranihabitans marinus]MBY5958835.1 SufE family protein [Membranihabitans marinus]
MDKQTIDEKQNEIIEEFSYFDDWMDKYELLIQLGKEVPLIDDQYKKDEHLIKGCQSQVWMHAEEKNGKVFYTADSDAIITKGLVSLVIKVLSGHKAEDIASSKLYFIQKIGLQNHLSPTRSNGLLAMIKQMKLYAVALQQQKIK